MPKKEVNGSEGHLFRLLRAKYSSDQYVLLRHIQSGVSTSSSAYFRVADVVAIGVWKSRDPNIYGFEMKSSRASWLQELQEPAKADEIGKYCDYWWIVASGPNVVDPKELPASWGLYVLEHGELKVSVPAKKMDPIPLDSVFVSNLLRGAMEPKNPLDVESKETAYKEGYQNGYREGEDHTRKATKEVIANLTDRLHDETKTMKELQEILGVNIVKMDLEALKSLRGVLELYRLTERYKKVSPERIKELLEAYKLLATGPVDHVVERLMKISYAVKEIGRFVDGKIEQLPKIEDGSFNWLADIRMGAMKLLSEPLPEDPPSQEASGT